MTGGSTLVCFELKGGKQAAFAFQNALEIVLISNNLGDAKSLITHPATTTHKNLTEEARAELGIGPGTLRLSAGLEDADDLIEDIAPVGHNELIQAQSGSTFFEIGRSTESPCVLAIRGRKTIATFRWNCSRNCAPRARYAPARCRSQSAAKA